MTLIQTYAFCTNEMVCAVFLLLFYIVKMVISPFHSPVLCGTESHTDMFYLPPTAPLCLCYTNYFAAQNVAWKLDSV